MIKRKSWTIGWDVYACAWTPSFDSIMNEINNLARDHHIINVAEYRHPNDANCCTITAFYYFMGEQDRDGV